MRKLKVDNKKILSNLLEIDKSIIVDLLISLYNENSLGIYFKKYIGNDFNYNQNKNLTILPIIINSILTKDRYFDIFLDLMIKQNNNYIKNRTYANFELEELEEEYKKDWLPAQHGKGISPEMMILFYFSRNIFDNEIIDLSKKYYLQTLKKIEDSKDRYVPNSIEIITKSETIKDDVNAFFMEYEIKDFDKNDFVEVAEKLKCDYDPNTKKFNNVRRGVIFYLYYKLDILFSNIDYVQSLIEVLTKATVKLNLFLEKEMILTKELFSNREKIIELNNKNKKLSKENIVLKTIIDNSTKKETTDNKDKQIEQLKKSNYYLQLRIEKLEEEKSELEEEKEINKTIEENIVIKENKKIIKLKKEKPIYKKILILGGFWNNKTKSEVEEYLEDNEIEFVDAEKTLRKFDKIKSADIVIFDTSRNAHTYFDKIKNNKIKLELINKSSLENIKELYQEILER